MESRYLLILTDNLSILNIVLDDFHDQNLNPEVVFGSRFKDDLSYTQVRHILIVDQFSGYLPTICPVLSLCTRPIPNRGSITFHCHLGVGNQPTLDTLILASKKFHTFEFIR